MRRDPRVLVPVICLATIHMLVFAAGFVAPYDYSQQNREAILSPPTKLHWIDNKGKIHLRPFIYQSIESPEVPSDYQEDVTVPYPVRLLVTTSRESIQGPSFQRRHLFAVDPPARLFLMGTDDLGRDVFSRLVYGGRISLLSGLMAAILALGMALILGSIAGFYGSWVDAITMRCAELFLALPWLYLLLAVRAALPLHIDSLRIFFIVIALIGALGWARPTRLVRGMALSLRERHYVMAARSFGASDLYLIRRHIMPAMGGLLLTQAALLVPQYVLAEVTLSFFGLGIGEPIPSWGSMLASLQQYRVLVSAWWMFSPGVVMAVVFLSYQSLHGTLRTSLSIAELK